METAPTTRQRRAAARSARLRHRRRGPAPWAQAALAIGTSSAFVLQGVIALAMPPAAGHESIPLGGRTTALLTHLVPPRLAPLTLVALPEFEVVPDSRTMPSIPAPPHDDPAPSIQFAGPVDGAVLAAALAQARRIKTLRTKIHFQAHAPETCLPVELMGVIYDVAEKFGPVRIASTHRDPQRNRRVGGRPRSFHLECRAIDFFVEGSTKGLAEYLRGRPEVGGHKRYPQGFFHIDNGPRRTW